MAEPGQLSLGEVARASLNLLDRGLVSGLAVEVLEDLLVSERLTRLPAERVRLSAQGPALLDESRRHHRMNSGVDAAVQLLARQVQAPHPTGEAGRRVDRPLVLPGADGPAGQFPDLQGADDSPDVVGVQS